MYSRIMRFFEAKGRMGVERECSVSPLSILSKKKQLLNYNKAAEHLRNLVKTSSRSFNHLFIALRLDDELSVF